MSQRIRGAEASLNLIVDGDLKGGSFAKVKSFNLTPRTDVVETSYLGEVEDDLDVQHHGYDFDFEIDQLDAKAYDLLQVIVAREKLRLPHPAINLVATLRFRSLLEPSKVFVLESCFIKLDAFSFAGRKEYIGAKFSGKCKNVTTLM